MPPSATPDPCREVFWSGDFNIEVEACLFFFSFCFPPYIPYNATYVLSPENNKIKLTCPLFAGEGQVIVAGHIVPLPPLMPDHHHTVLSRLEEAVRLVRPPVIILLPEHVFSLL